MFFRRFFNEGLAQASYLVGCEATGEAIVVDPNRDATQYVEAAAAEELSIRYVAETHIHADFVSGSRQLASGTGATMLLSGEGGDDWQYGFAVGDHATLLHDGDNVDVGRVRFRVLHTPGHTPEHLSFLVTDRAASDSPLGLFSGDFVFVGDVGRPDLLDKTGLGSGTMESAARALFRSLQVFRTLPDHVQVWPGHGAGSACGKALGAMPQSTVGYERIANWGVATLDVEAFVRDVLADQPEAPPYFAEMKRINRAGPRIVGGLPLATELAPAELVRRAAAGSLVIDLRPTSEFAEGHIPGSLNLPAGSSLSRWAGWLLSSKVEIHLVAHDAGEAARAARTLSLIGLERLGGWSPHSALEAWVQSGRALDVVAQTTTGELEPMIGRSDLTIVDVRTAAEWQAGHIEGAVNIPLGDLPARLVEVPTNSPVVLHCQGGTRSAIAASVLLANGVRDVSNLRGGYREWARRSEPATRL